MASELRRGLVSLEQASAPPTPAAGKRLLFPKSDGWYEKTSAGVETKLAAASAVAPLTARTTAAVNNSTVTPAVITGLAVNADAQKTYRILAHGAFRTAATTTGIGIRLGGTATATRCRYNTHLIGGAAANQDYFVYTALSQALNFSAGVTLTTRGYPWNLEGILVINAAGTIQVEFASEVAASTATIDADAYLELQEVA